MSRSIRRPEEGLTLAELLVVIAILGLLAVAAAPSILEAQTRAKVAAAKAHTRLLASALEAYAVDRGSFPPAASAFPDDPLGLLAEEQLRVLTEPSSAHLSESAFRDPFGLVTPSREGPSPSAVSDPLRAALELPPPNPRRSLMYFHYPSLAKRVDEPALSIQGAAIVSLGPDAKDSLGAYRPFSADIFRRVFSAARGFAGPDASKHPINGIYDPTNGVASSGDIAAFAGEGNIFAHP